MRNYAQRTTATMVAVSIQTALCAERKVPACQTARGRIQKIVQKIRKKTQTSRKIPTSVSTTGSMMIPAATCRNRRTVGGVLVPMSAVSALLKS
ncbi:hypothetical protein IMSAGC002_03735 [Lachnospiraceae bacterium]|nr:hypothetical protein IMSAGC002_03735 [Lachnospiraceae bacterium]GFI31223.1 hypothetical protein IMSAGC013_02617 [Lachnospiraceae bacterium]